MPATHAQHPTAAVSGPSLAPQSESVSTVQFGSRWTASSCTVRNERRDCTNPKPNEDRVFIDTDRLCVVVADGITRTKNQDDSYPDPSPSATAAQVFCDTVQALIRQAPSIRSTDTLRSIMASANVAIANFNQRAFPRFDFAERDRAGLAAVVGIFDEDTLWLASIADCWCLGFKEDTAHRFAWEKTSHSRPEYNRLGEIPAREALRNRPGNPFAYGALTGEAEALQFVEYARIPVKDIQRLVFASDGLIRVAEEDPNALRTHSPTEIIRYGRILDRAHNETDDKTLVVVDRLQTS